ncbi:hypothetical protein DFJ63DRAFT_60465 [Scheffersomyces coipomensis]|uniref:uncharacterized protein n=1 Tax=Scheffersomyces coipomensis TaxID=1788519 RepID=UPI00315DCB8C
MSTELPLVYYNDDKKSFAYPTIHSRWPKIIQGAINDVQTVINENSNLESSGNVIVSQLKALLKSFKDDELVRPFTEEEITNSKEDLKSYNQLLIKHDAIKVKHFNQHITWQNGPWLLLECYLYQYLNNIIIGQGSIEKYWTSFDIFKALKDSTFQQSEFGVLELLNKYYKLSTELNASTKEIGSEEKFLLFKDFIDVSLWGNATDLSLLAGNITLEDIKSLQGDEIRKQNEKNILVNDISSAWEHLKINKHKRIDIVLDNSGFELYSDLILALFLLDFKIVSTIVLHCKTIPWFVSDTRVVDVHTIFSQLKDESFFPQIHQEHPEQIKYLNQRLADVVKDGQLKFDDHEYWTLGDSYWDLSSNPIAKSLYEELLHNSSLIIFKGDLNYRKLTGDLQWDKTTPFKVALQQLASESKLPVLSLRTCKADVVVGLPQGINESLIKLYKEQGNEIGEFWSSSGKWAVISFSDGK